MPVQVFNTINELLSYLTAQLPTQGNQEITAARHREVMHSTVLSLYALVNGLPGQTVNEFSPWQSEDTYTGGAEVVVRHGGRLWLFVSAEDRTGTEPGTNGLVWAEISAVQLAHFRDRDQRLDAGGPYEVTAEEIRVALDGELAGTGVYRPVDSLSGWPDWDQPAGYRFIVGYWDEAFSGLFEGREGHIAERTASGWRFEIPVLYHRVYLKGVPFSLEQSQCYLYAGFDWIEVGSFAALVGMGGGHTGGTPLVFTRPPVYPSDVHGWDSPVIHLVPDDLDEIVVPAINVDEVPVSYIVRRYVHLQNNEATESSVVWPGGLGTADGVTLPATISVGQTILVEVTQIGAAHVATSVTIIS